MQIGYLTFKTKTYIPLVTRCYKCQKYGHIAANCKHTSLFVQARIVMKNVRLKILKSVLNAVVPIV